MEELATFAKQRSFKRKVMEAQDVDCQMRRIHIVYYLSHNGRIEHPHLIRIHRLSRKGVYLRDVKRWLSELRGKDMPESFAWSYKRYKGWYVWQDLLDGDLITPICDNEYVLKGSQISSRTLDNDLSSLDGKEVFELKKLAPFEEKTNDPKYASMRKEYSLDFLTNTSIEIEESSFASNEDTTKHQDGNKDEEVVQIPNDKNENSSIYETLLNKNTNDNNNNDNNDKSKSKKGGVKSVASGFKEPHLPTYSFEKSSSFSRASHMFRNWITCGTAKTNENAVVVINKRKGSRISTVILDSENNSNENVVGLICKEQKFGGFEKRFDDKRGSKKSKEEPKSNTTRTFGVAYKPVNGPNCSQCGRQFNPEKFHNHMKYCRGMKAMAKSTNSRPKPKTSTPFSPSSASRETFLLDK